MRRDVPLFLTTLEMQEGNGRSPVGPPRLHHAKTHSGLRNLLLGGVAVILVLGPNVSATIASVELDRQVRWAFE